LLCRSRFLAGGDIRDSVDVADANRIPVRISRGCGSATNRPRRALMLRNTVRGVLGLVLVAAATWLANYLTELMFGPENSDTGA
jgi:hypothetical protein